LTLACPDGDGLTVLAATRQSGKNLPILILTARDAVEDRVAGLNAGADGQRFNAGNQLNGNRV
jgi:two-component system response regulator QseB